MSHFNWITSPNRMFRFASQQCQQKREWWEDSCLLTNFNEVRHLKSFIIMAPKDNYKVNYVTFLNILIIFIYIPKIM